MSKFKVGDRVLAVANVDYEQKYRPGTLTSVTECRHTKYRVDFDGWANLWPESNAHVKPLTTNKIIITSNGTTTTARLYDGKTVVKTAEAKCSPSDTYDFTIGANLAYDRLMLAETLAATVKPEDKPEIKTKYNVGDRVKGSHGPGTVICYSKDGLYGVEFDDSHTQGHNCGGIPLVFGKTGAYDRCWWQLEGQLSSLDEQPKVQDKQEIKPAPKYWSGKIFITKFAEYKGEQS